MNLHRYPRRAGVSTKLVLIVIGVPVVIVTLAGIFIMRGGGPELVVRQFMAAVAQGDVHTLESLVPAQDAELVKLLPKTAEPPGLDIGKAKIEGNTAFVKVTMSIRIPGMLEPLTQSQNFQLVKENGEWKVDLTAMEAAQAAAQQGMGAGSGGMGAGAGEGGPVPGAPGVEVVPAPGESPSAAPPTAEQAPSTPAPHGKKKSSH
jgi:hypothetical protein